jgi:hypothetical protein
VAFRELMARRNYREAAAPLSLLLDEARAKRYWVEPDLLREGAVLVLLAGEDPKGARAAFDLLMPVAQQGPADVRTRLLDAYIRGMEGRGSGLESQSP